MSHFRRCPCFVPAVLLCAFGLCAEVRAVGIPVGRGRLETSLGVRGDYDSNIFLNNKDKDDFVTTGTASLRYVHDVGLISADAALTATGTKYADYTDEDSFDPALRGRATYTPSDKTTITGGLLLQRSSIANDAVNARTKSDDVAFDGSFQNLFSEKLGYRLLGGFNEGNYLTAGYADVFSYNAGVSAVYTYSPKLTTLTGFNYRQSWTHNRQINTGDPSSKDYRYFIGFEGELAPKVTGTLDVGVVQRKFDTADFDGSTSMFLSTGLKWIATQKTTVSLDGSQDFGLTAANQSSKVMSVSLNAMHVLNPKWSLDGGVAFTHATYDANIVNAQAFSRTDDNVRFRGRVSYAFATNINVDVSAGYATVDSSRDYATYDRVNVGVGVTATF